MLRLFLLLVLGSNTNAGDAVVTTTTVPSQPPTASPTGTPTSSPSLGPSMRPTTHPTQAPTLNFTLPPTLAPTALVPTTTRTPGCRDIFGWIDGPYGRHKETCQAYYSTSVYRYAGNRACSDAVKYRNKVECSEFFGMDATTACCVCGGGIREIDGAYEYAVVRGAYTWPEARATCQRRGSGWELASIHSYRDNVRLRMATWSTSHVAVDRILWHSFRHRPYHPYYGGLSCWIGLNNLANQTWGWSELSAHRYTDWAGNMPSLPGHACAHAMANLRWSDQSCVNYRSHACCGRLRKRSNQSLANNEHAIQNIDWAQIYNGSNTTQNRSRFIVGNGLFQLSELDPNLRRCEYPKIPWTLYALGCATSFLLHFFAIGCLWTNEFPFPKTSCGVFQTLLLLPYFGYCVWKICFVYYYDFRNVFAFIFNGENTSATCRLGEWINYQCLLLVTMNSPNFKHFVCILFIFMYVEDNITRKSTLTGERRTTRFLFWKTERPVTGFDGPNLICFESVLAFNAADVLFYLPIVYGFIYIACFCTHMVPGFEYVPVMFVMLILVIFTTFFLHKMSEKLICFVEPLLDCFDDARERWIRPTNPDIEMYKMPGGSPSPSKGPQRLAPTPTRIFLSGPTPTGEPEYHIGDFIEVKVKEEGWLPAYVTLTFDDGNVEGKLVDGRSFKCKPNEGNLKKGTGRHPFAVGDWVEVNDAFQDVQPGDVGRIESVIGSNKPILDIAFGHTGGTKWVLPEHFRCICKVEAPNWAAEIGGGSRRLTRSKTLNAGAAQSCLPRSMSLRSRTGAAFTTGQRVRIRGMTRAFDAIYNNTFATVVGEDMNGYKVFLDYSKALQQRNIVVKAENLEKVKVKRVYIHHKGGKWALGDRNSGKYDLEVSSAHQVQFSFKNTFGDGYYLYDVENAQRLEKSEARRREKPGHMWAPGHPGIKQLEVWKKASGVLMAKKPERKKHTFTILVKPSTDSVVHEDLDRQERRAAALSTEEIEKHQRRVTRSKSASDLSAVVRESAIGGTVRQLQKADHATRTSTVRSEESEKELRRSSRRQAEKEAEAKLREDRLAGDMYQIRKREEQGRKAQQQEEETEKERRREAKLDKDKEAAAQAREEQIGGDIYDIRARDEERRKAHENEEEVEKEHRRAGKVDRDKEAAARERESMLGGDMYTIRVRDEEQRKQKQFDEESVKGGRRLTRTDSDREGAWQERQAAKQSLRRIASDESIQVKQHVYRKGERVRAIYNIDYGTSKVAARTEGTLVSVKVERGSTQVTVRWDGYSKLGNVRARNNQIEPCSITRQESVENEFAVGDTVRAIASISYGSSGDIPVGSKGVKQANEIRPLESRTKAKALERSRSSESLISTAPACLEVTNKWTDSAMIGVYYLQSGLAGGRHFWTQKGEPWVIRWSSQTKQWFIDSKLRSGKDSKVLSSLGAYSAKDLGERDPSRCINWWVKKDSKWTQDSGLVVHKQSEQWGDAQAEFASFEVGDRVRITADITKSKTVDDPRMTTEKRRFVTRLQGKEGTIVAGDNGTNLAQGKVKYPVKMDGTGKTYYISAKEMTFLSSAGGMLTRQLSFASKDMLLSRNQNIRIERLDALSTFLYKWFFFIAFCVTTIIICELKVSRYAKWRSSSFTYMNNIKFILGSPQIVGRWRLWEPYMESIRNNKDNWYYFLSYMT